MAVSNVVLVTLTSVTVTPVPLTPTDVPPETKFVPVSVIAMTLVRTPSGGLTLVSVGAVRFTANERLFAVPPAVVRSCARAGRRVGGKRTSPSGTYRSRR